MKTRPLSYSKRSGFSLVEVTLALGICAFCLISLVGLLPPGIAATNNASRETEAANLASALLADLQMSVILSTGSNGALTRQLGSTTALYRFPSAIGENSRNFITLATDGTEKWEPTTQSGQYRVKARVTRESADTPYSFTVKVSWPGVTAAAAKEQGSVTVIGRSR